MNTPVSSFGTGIRDCSQMLVFLGCHGLHPRGGKLYVFLPTQTRWIP